MATELHGDALGVPLFQQIQRKRRRTILGDSPNEVFVHGPLKGLFDHRVGVPQQHVQARWETVDAMQKHGKMDGRVPRDRIPRHWALRHGETCMRPDALKHREKLPGGDRRRSVKGNGTSSLMDDLMSGEDGWVSVTCVVG